MHPSPNGSDWIHHYFVNYAVGPGKSEALSSLVSHWSLPNKECYAMKRDTIYSLGYFMDLLVPRPLIFSPLGVKCTEPQVHPCYVNTCSNTASLLWSEVETLLLDSHPAFSEASQKPSAAWERWATSLSLWMGLHNSFKISYETDKKPGKLCLLLQKILTEAWAG